MEETELEEGEALSYDNEAQDPTIDPEIALSYIGEKLQNVLGHFQKDFEGGVSAENLGAKFGGYGSFLPTYQRSPSWSQTRSQAEVHNYDSPRSPKKLHVEDQRQNSLTSSSASPSARARATSGKAASVGNSLKGNNSYLQSKHAEESSLKSGAVKKSLNSSDQRTLKVRIKVGSESLLAQKNADIYSGLGLVVSPSSSLDDSPTTSEGQCGKVTDAPEASPTSILQIMTSYPGELLLSPLSDDLIHLTEKRKPKGKNETKLKGKTSTESSGMLVNGSLIGKGNQKKSKSSGKDDVFSIKLINRKHNNMDNTVSLLKEKETEIDTLGCEKLVSNALKLPLLSSSQNTLPDPAKDNPTATNALNDVAKGETFSAFTEKKRHLDNESARAIGGVENLSGKLGSSGKISESKRANLVSDIGPFPQAEVPRTEIPSALEQSESIVSKGRKSEEGLKQALGKSSSGGKRKQKVAHSTGARDAYKSKNVSYYPRQDHERPGDRYKDFFGDVEFEDEDNESVSGEMTSSGRLKNFQLVGKISSSNDHNMSKEKFNRKVSVKPQLSEKIPGLASQSAPPLGNGPSSEAPIGSVPLVKEDWVSCDKCQKWRLLPLGTNLKSLPDKWLCRMLTWLPGMNRCSVSEDETTNALRALYHPAASIPGPTFESQHSQLDNSVVNTLQMASADAGYPGQENQNSALQTATVSGKKNHGSTKAANSIDHDGSTNSSNSRKKSLGTCGKISILNSGKNSTSLDAIGHLHLRQSNSAVDKHSDPKKPKLSLVSSSVKGANIKIRRKRDADMEISRPSKRIKSEESHFDDNNWASDNGGTSSKADRRLTSLSNNTSGSDQSKYNSQKHLTEALDNADAQKASNLRKKAEKSNGQPIRNFTPTSHKFRDADVPSSVQRDSSGHTADSALKEAKDLKHLADRMKNSGSTKSIETYFQAALKFLHGALLLESGSSEATKHNDLMHSVHIYSSTAKLFEFCAHENEKSKDVAAAALAYKCVEVAYLRVAYSSHASANRDRNELQSALQIVPPGESPSSSASDVDNLNHAATTDKAALARVVGAPQVSGSHVITPRNCSGVLRILNFVQDVNSAMEASRKSRLAFTAATSRLGETLPKESINSLKEALDFNFQDVEGFLRLVRIAMESISR